MCDPNKGDSDLPKVYHLHQKKKKRNFCQKLKPFTLKDINLPMAIFANTDNFSSNSLQSFYNSPFQRSMLMDSFRTELES